MAAPSTAAAIALPILTLLAFLYHRATHRRPYSGIPYNPHSTRRLFGDMPELTAEAQRHRDPARMILSQFEKLGGPVIQLFLMPFWRPLVYISDTREIEDLLQNRLREFDKSPALIRPFKPIVPGSSLAKVRGPEWRAQVRLWSDIISVGFLRDQAAPIMYRAASELVELWRMRARVAGGRPFWVRDDFKIATYDVIWKVLLGSDVDAVKSEREIVLEWAHAIEQPGSMDEPAEMAVAPMREEFEAGTYFTDLIPATLVSPIPGVLHFLWSLTPKWRRHWATTRRLMSELLELSKARFADLGDAKEDEGVAKTRDVCALDRALRRFGKVSPDDIYRPTIDDMFDELFLLLVSGHETTASLLSWAVKVLTNAPAEQARLRDALRAHFPTSPQIPPVEAILAAKIPYLDASIEELLRKSNVIPEIVREAACDAELLGHRVPKGATLVCSTYVAHKPFAVPDAVRSATSRANTAYGAFWQPDMDEFHPERWLRADGSFEAKALPRLAFGTGTRACFGRKFATQQFRILLVVMLLNFELLPIPDHLNNFDALSKITRSPRQCFVRMSPI